MTADAEVVVIGGGATGCSVARDLAMRGVGVTLVERDTLNAGTTGRSHGVLHSGARYADEDPESAADCRRENRILRRVAGAAVADAGGYFLQLEGDDPGYFETKRAACRDVGIETEALDRAAILAREPTVTKAVERALSVPDAVISPARFVAATAESARRHGTELLVGATVDEIELGSRPTVHFTTAAGPQAITTEHVVNAAGPWAGAVAGLAGLEVGMAPTRGVMVELADPGVSAVLNRCRPPTDGDLVVPHPDAVVCGTTSVPVDDPDDTGGERTEVERVRAEGAAMVPALAGAAVRRQFWGVRPLAEAGGRAASRGFGLLDHDDRDGAAGMTTVVGGKLTTARLMGEAVGDHVAGRLGVEPASRTDEVPLPGHDDADRLDDLVAAFDAAGPGDPGFEDADR